MSEFKETEFGTIPTKWIYVRGTDYCSKVTDGTHDSPKQVSHGRYLITSKHIKGRDIDFENAYLISEEDYKKIIERSHVDQWDVIISMIGEYCGFTYIERNPNPNYAVKNVGMFKTGNEHRAKWLHYYLNSKIGKAVLEAQKTGTSQPYITLGSLRNLEILLPDNEDDIISIAEVLSSLDDKIDLLHRNNKTLEQMAETLFRQWFVVEAKEEWEEKKVSDIIEIRDGTHDSPKQAENGRYLVTSKNLRPNEIDFTSAYKISEADYHLINKRSVVEEGDILISMIGTLGLLHLVVEKPDYAIKNIGLFKSSQKPWFSRFLLLLLKSPVGKNYIYENADGSTQEYISLGSLRKFSFNYPGEEIIRAFDNQVEPLFNKVKHNSAQIRTLSKTRDTLLPKLMSGQVRVKTD